MWEPKEPENAQHLRQRYNGFRSRKQLPGRGKGDIVRRMTPRARDPPLRFPGLSSEWSQLYGAHVSRFVAECAVQCVSARCPGGGIQEKCE